jgi:hypothetical protein
MLLAPAVGVVRPGILRRPVDLEEGDARMVGHDARPVVSRDHHAKVGIPLRPDGGQGQVEQSLIRGQFCAEARAISAFPR